ncbi:hypothetical protein ACNF49_38360 [Actinomadura sp. ATCC 39365]
MMKRTSSPNATPDRSNDRLLTFPEEVCALTRRSEATERYLRHHQRTNYLFRMGRRLVAWHSDVIAHIEAARIADQQDQGSAA